MAVKKIAISKVSKMLRPFHGKGKVSLTNVVGKTGYQHASWTLSYTIHKSAPKCIRDLSVRPVTVKLRRKAYDSRFGKDFLNITSKALATKAKIDKLNYI